MKIILKKGKQAPPVAQVGTVKSESGKVVAEKHEYVPVPEIKTQAHEAQPQSNDGKPWCTVGYGSGFTHAPQPFHSVRVDVYLAVPCAHHEIDKVFQVVNDWVDTRVNKAHKEIAGE